ncbi:MarR family transcriptional regulator [Myxococcaceae bacterium JPH2]|nr:MarR family transcriptional regulator [Myxococcaceae bacterium JPH2]
MSQLTPEGEAIARLNVEVFRLNGLLLEAGDRLSAPVGLSSARWQVLGVVDHGPEPVATIARIMGLRRQSVQQTADALEKDGFIQYEENPFHRRAKRVALLPKGREALRRVELELAKWANRLGATSRVKALHGALETLRQLRESLEQDRAQWDDGSP